MTTPIIMQYGNQLIDVRDIKPENIRPREVCSALGNLCRWNGWTHPYYSVAEHSIRVADRVESPEDKLWALLHDAAEAYLGDLSTPIKRACPVFMELEAIVMRAVCQRFDIPEEMPAAVHEADQRMLATEARDILPCAPLWTPGYAPYDDRIYGAGLMPEIASAALYEHIRAITGGQTLERRIRPTVSVIELAEQKSAEEARAR